LKEKFDIPSYQALKKHSWVGSNPEFIFYLKALTLVNKQLSCRERLAYILPPRSKFPIFL